MLPIILGQFQPPLNYRTEARDMDVGLYNRSGAKQEYLSKLSAD
jgi:hypothetical protein